MIKRKSWVSFLYSTGSVITLFLLWQIYSIQVNNPTLMPMPLDVIERFFALIFEAETYNVVGHSLFRLLVSLALSVILGTGLGLLSGMKYQFEAIMTPIVISLRTLPVLSIIVVVLIMFGNVFTLYIVSFLLLFPIIYQAELDGIKNIDPLLIDVLRLDCTDYCFGSIRLVFFPLSLPFLRTALIDAVGLAIKVLIVAEYIAQTKVSIGKEIYIHKLNLEYTDLFAWTFILLLMALIIDYAVERLLKTRR